MTDYIALIRKEAGSDFGVSFPDLPGCATAGKDLDEALAFAREALALHLKGLASLRIKIVIEAALESLSGA